MIYRLLKLVIFHREVKLSEGTFKLGHIKDMSGYHEWISVVCYMYSQLMICQKHVFSHLKSGMRIQVSQMVIFPIVLTVHNEPRCEMILWDFVGMAYVCQYIEI